MANIWLKVAIISALQVLVIACQVGTQVCTNVLNLLTKKGRRERKLLEDINNVIVDLSFNECVCNSN